MLVATESTRFLEAGSFVGFTGGDLDLANTALAGPGSMRESRLRISRDDKGPKEMRTSELPVFVALGAMLMVGVATNAVAAVPTAVMANFITAGALDPNGKVPALNAVPGSAVPNLSVAIPLAILQHGVAYNYLVSSQNVTYNGTCTDSFSLIQGSGASKKVLDSGTIHTYTCAPSTTWEWVKTGKPVPNSPGLATLYGIVTFGTTKVATKTIVLIQ